MLLFHNTSAMQCKNCFCVCEVNTFCIKVPELVEGSCHQVFKLWSGAYFASVVLCAQIWILDLLGKFTIKWDHI